MRDLKNNLDAVQTIAPAGYASDVNGTGVDLQGFNAAMVIFHCGDIADGTHTPKVQESDSLASGYTDVASEDLEGSLVAMTTNSVQRIGYKGSKRFIKGFVTVSGASSGGAYGAEVVRGNPNIAPV